MKTARQLILFTAGLLSACSATPEAALLASLPPTQSAWQVKLPGEQGASLAVRISPAAGSADFSLKNSLDGADHKQVSDILAYRVFLVSSPVTPTGVLTPYLSQIVTVADNNSGNQTIVFSNVPAGSFYACAAAFDSATVFSNATNLNEDLGSPTSYSEGPVSCSNSGGDGGTFPGQVRVDSAWQLLTSGVVGINLNLRGRRGATIDTRVLVIDGP